MPDYKKQVRDMLTSIVYEELFGKTRIELITEAKKYHVAELVAMHNGDQDEILRDYMTVDALNVLGNCEANLVDMYAKRRYTTLEDFIRITHIVAKHWHNKVGAIQLWDNESTDDET